MLRRRDLAAALAAAAGGAALAAVWRPGFLHAQERVVRITARKFEFAPREIALRVGEAVVFELESLDRLHGFDAPSFGLKGEFVPGQITKLRFVPQRAGKFGFTCNVFCGDGHEEMDGEIVVLER